MEATFWELNKIYPNIIIDPEKTKNGVICWRVDMQNTEDVENFITNFSSITKTAWVLYHQTRNPQRMLFSKTWLCQHAKRHKEPNSPRSADCKARLSITIKKVTQATRKRDKFLKGEVCLPCEIKVSAEHTHQTDSAEFLKMLRVNDEVKEQYYEYFSKGMTPAEAIRCHENNFLWEENSTALTDASINPTPNQVYHLHKVWRENLGSPVNPFEQSEENIPFYESKNSLHAASTLESVGTEKSHPCELCGDTFFTKHALKVHYRKHTDELPHECSTCGEGFRTIWRLRSHERSHLTSLPHACPHCPFRTANASYLPHHIASQHTKVFLVVCPVCSKGFFNRSYYVSHVKEMHLIAFKCDVLNVFFASVLALRGYQKCSEQTDGKSHSNQCPFSTDYKGASEHPLLSAGKKVHKYDNCGKVCSQKRHLETHLLACKKPEKSEKRPFHCSRCPYSTSLSERLMRHLLTHKEPFKCELCDKTFTTKYSLETHLMAHAGDRPHVCSICGKGFFRICHMQQHEKTHTKAKKS